MAYRQIKQFVLDGRLDEGARLTEDAVAQVLGISKSPVREAFNRLESEGLIRIEPRRGAYLRSFTTREIEDLYDLREALEVHAVGEAQITDDVIASLRASLENSTRMHEANEKLKYIDEDIRFHAILAGAAGNLRLSQALENLQHQLTLFRRKTYDLSSSRAVEAHSAIVAALERRDRTAAQDALREHIRSTCERLVQYLGRTR